MQRIVRVIATLVLASSCCASTLHADKPEQKSGSKPTEKAKAEAPAAGHGHHHANHVHFDAQSVADGNWSDPKTWSNGKLPTAGARILIKRGTRVVFDVKQPAVFRLLQIVGTLSFARDRDTELNACVIKVQDSDVCSDSGFACDF